MARMSAEGRIKHLTNEWYGFVVLSGAIGVVLEGFGSFTLLSGAFSTLLSLLLTYWLGQRLLGRSSLTRVFLVIVSGVMFCVGLVGSGKLALSFFHEWSAELLGYAALGAMGVYMNGRSFRALRSPEVKAYFA